MRIKKAVEKILNDNPNLTKYRLARNIGTTPSNVANWLDRDTGSIHLKYAKEIYRHYKIEVYPYTKEELK